MKAWDEDGIEIDLDKLIGITVRCFMCTEQLQSKGGILISPPEQEFSDNVDKVDKFHLCKKCFNVLLDFSMGKIKQVEVPPKLDLILYSVIKGDNKHAKKQIDELKKELLAGQKVEVQQKNE